MKKRFTATPVFAASEFDRLLSGVKEAFNVSDAAARIIANWYYNEEIDFDEFEDMDEFIEYVQSDIPEMLEAADRDEDFYLVVKELKQDGYDLEEFEDFEEDEILQMAQLHFEYGTNYKLRDFSGDQEAYDQYLDLVDLGPAGFYEEYKDTLDFHDDFISEYGCEDY